MVMTFVITVLIVLLIIMLWAMFTNNSLIAKRNRVRQCRSGICVAIKQRNDMIPNLISAVKAYMVHENETLTRIAELRSQSMSDSERQQIDEGNEISSLLSRLNVAVENYPALKADGQFMELQRSIIDMECELQAIRRTYNAAVTDYNNCIEMFPSSIFASWRNFQEEELIEIPPENMRDINVAQMFEK